MNLGNVFILGDSYSTYKDYIPKYCSTWYPNENNGVVSVEDTWWMQLINRTSSVLLQNNSSSGTTIGNTGYNACDCSETSFIGRLDKLIEEGYFESNRVDTLLIFGGTNDSWADAPIGEIMESDWKREDLFYVLPAFSYLLHRIKENIPSARVVCIINTGLKSEIADNLKQISLKNGIDTVVLENIDKIDGHPSAIGMTQIMEQVLSSFNKK